MKNPPILESREFFETDMVAPEACPLGAGKVCVFSTRCPRNETPNEDAAAVLPVSETAGVVAVADGMGGLAAGNVASRTALTAMRTSISSLAKEPVMMRTAVLNGFESANEQVCDRVSSGGTTLAVVEIDGNTARPYHVGDSAIFIIGGRGKMKFQSIAHSPTGYGVEAGLLDAVEALGHNERHLLSNMVGSRDMRIDVGPVVELAPRDTVLLCSDGLVDNLHIDEICAYMRKGSLEAAIQQLAEETHRRMAASEGDLPSKPDDLTIVGYRSNQRS